LLRQRRVQDPAKRRELILDIQRYLAKMVYRAEAYSLVLPAVWDPALKNYGPNLGYDYGGRLMAAWLDRGEESGDPYRDRGTTGYLTRAAFLGLSPRPRCSSRISARTLSGGAYSWTTPSGASRAAMAGY